MTSYLLNKSLEKNKEYKYLRPSLLGVQTLIDIHAVTSTKELSLLRNLFSCDILKTKRFASKLKSDLVQVVIKGLKIQIAIHKVSPQAK